jgi:hypothetical protein
VNCEDWELGITSCAVCTICKKKPANVYRIGEQWCLDCYPKTPSPHKTFSATFPAAKRKAIRERMTQLGFGDDRNLMVWMFLKGQGWDLVPIEILLDHYETLLEQLRNSHSITIPSTNDGLAL